MALGTAATCDPRILRTRRLLQQALDKLLNIKNFDAISVQDIADEATVNRATFYDHYTDKFELLGCLVGTRFLELLAERQVQFDGTCAAALKAIVHAVCDYVVRMQGSDCTRNLEPHMESAIIAVVRATLLDGLKRHPLKEAMAPEMIAASASWAIYGAAREWMLTPGRCGAEEIADAVTRLVSPMLQLPSGPTLHSTTSECP